MSPATKLCNGCKKLKPETDFPLKKEGGSARWARCMKCREREGGHAPDGTARPRELRTYTLDQSLPLMPLTDFLNFVAAQNSAGTIETRIEQSSANDDLLVLDSAVAYKKLADQLKDMLNEVMPYRFVYVASFGKNLT